GSSGHSLRPRSHRYRTIQPGRAQLRHLLAAAQGADRLHHRSDRGPHVLADHRAAAVPRVGEPEKGHLHVHQLAGRRGDGWPRDPRHHAVHPPAGRHRVHRPGGVHGQLPAGGRRAGHAGRADQQPDHGPPAFGRRAGHGVGHRDPGPRDPAHAHAPQLALRQVHRPGHRGDREGDGPRQVHGSRRSQDVRPDRRGIREAAGCRRRRGRGRRQQRFSGL
ncbi:MAG: ATP-dependent Clp protease proteolytic subunit, partial [uncultured Sphingomonas sp.]